MQAELYLLIPREITRYSHSINQHQPMRNRQPLMRHHQSLMLLLRLILYPPPVVYYAPAPVSYAPVYGGYGGYGYPGAYGGGYGCNPLFGAVSLIFNDGGDDNYRSCNGGGDGYYGNGGGYGYRGNGGGHYRSGNGGGYGFNYNDLAILFPVMAAVPGDNAMAAGIMALEIVVVLDTVEVATAIIALEKVAVEAGHWRIVFSGS